MNPDSPRNYFPKQEAIKPISPPETVEQIEERFLADNTRKMNTILSEKAKVASRLYFEISTSRREAKKGKDQLSKESIEKVISKLKERIYGTDTQKGELLISEIDIDDIFFDLFDESSQEVNDILKILREKNDLEQEVLDDLQTEYGITLDPLQDLFDQENILHLRAAALYYKLKFKEDPTEKLQKSFIKSLAQKYIQENHELPPKLSLLLTQEEKQELYDEEQKQHELRNDPETVERSRQRLQEILDRVDNEFLKEQREQGVDERFLPRILETEQIRQAKNLESATPSLCRPKKFDEIEKVLETFVNPSEIITILLEGI